MNLELLYKNNIKRKKQVIENIYNDFILKTSINNYWNNYKTKIIVFTIIIIILLIIAFFNKPSSLIASLTFFIILFVIFLFFNSYSIIGKENELTIKINSQNIIIDYKNLKNIYLDKHTYRIFFKKYNKYNIVILYENKMHNICDTILPVTLLKEKDIEKLFNNIKVKETNIDYKSKCMKYKLNIIFRKIIIFLIFTSIIIIFYLINYFSLSH